MTRKLAIQAKRDFTIAAGDEDCVDTVRGLWDDFIAADRFNPETDRLAVATLHGSSTLLGSFASLLDCARAAVSADDYRRRLQLTGYLSRKAHAQNDALLTILRDRVPDGINDERYWRFLRVFNVLSFDLGTATAQTDALVMALLAHTARGVSDPLAAARATWTALLDLASAGRQAAASYRRDTLPSELRDRHDVISAADERGRLDLIDHGRMVRSAIRATIARGYVLDRSAHVASLLDQMDEQRILLVSGAAGSGKSALAKTVAEHIELDRPVLAFQAVEFATPHINETLAKTQAALNATGLVSLLAAHDQTVLLIDGVERLLEHSVRDAFAQLLQIVARTPSLRLLLTCRDYSLETVRSALLAPAGLIPGMFTVGALSDDELSALAGSVPSLAPALQDSRMWSFLRTPYLLDLASRLDWSGANLPESGRAFREKCWRELVRDDAHTAGGLPGRREEVFVDVARRRATALRPYVKPGTHDPEALDALHAASLLARSPESDRLFAPAHDVLEDWAILNWLDDVALAGDPAAALASAVGGLPAVRRGLRRWLAERLETAPAATRDFILDVTARADVPQHFRDDCVVAALLSEAAPAFLEGCGDRVSNGDWALLREIVHLLRVACKTVPIWLPTSGLPSSLLVPVGPAWAPVLELVETVIDSLPASDALLVLGLVEDWALQIAIMTPAPSGAEAAGRIVSALLPRFDGYRFKEPRKRVLQVLLKIPAHVPTFMELAERARVGDRSDRSACEFAELAVSTLSSAYVSRDFPDVVFDILRARLLMREDDFDPHYSPALRVGECFGIREGGPLDYFPASALQGPFRALLDHHPQKAVSFIIELLNHAGNWYGGRLWPGHDLEPAVSITLEVPDTGPIQQWMNGRLYALYRGMTVGPYALQSALMALEAWLLEVATFERVDLDGWLLHLVRQSNNVMATGVVASVCVAHPGRSGRAALALLASRELIQCDKHRLAAEPANSIEVFPGMNPSHALYEAERRAANKLVHRQEDLESLAIRLQLTDLRDEVWKLIDAHRDALSDDEGEATLVWRLALHRMDVRGFRPVEPTPHVEPVNTTEGVRVYYGPGNIEPAVQSMVDRSREHLDDFNRHLRLRNAAHSAWTNARGPEATEWRALLADARALADEGEPSESHIGGGPGITAAVCVRDHLDELTPDELGWCAARVAIELPPRAAQGEELYLHSRMFGPDRAAAAVVPLLVAEAPSALTVEPTDLLVRVLTHRIREIAEYAYGGAGAFLGEQRQDFIIRCAAAATCEAKLRDFELAAERARRGDKSNAPSDVDRHVRRDVRSVLEGSVDEASRVIVTLPLDTWHGRRAARLISKLFDGRVSWPVAREFFRSTARWLAETWKEGGRRSAGSDRDYEAEIELSRVVAKFALKSPPDMAREMCAPIVELVDSETRDVADFLERLIAEADGNTEDCYWMLWQDFSDKIATAPWVRRLDRDQPYEAGLIDGVFLATYWKDGVTHWPRLDGEVHRVHALADRLPPSVTTVRAYARFLYTIGQQSLPAAFTTLGSLLGRGDAVRTASNSEVAYYLESLLGRFVYAQPHRLKSDAALNDAVLRLLDALVAAGSSAAYRMRDDFVTPLGASAAEWNATMTRPSSG